MISVIMPVRNGGETLGKAIESILVQTFQKIELIIIDDCSTDNSFEIMSAYAQSNPNIRVVKNETNLGLSKNLNRALEMASFELVSRMDQDDEAFPERLARQHQYLIENPNVAAVGGQVLLVGKRMEFDFPLHYEVDPTLAQTKLLKYSVLSHPTVMYRKSVILKLGGYRAFFKNAEDYDLWLRLVRNGYGIGNVSEAVLRYRLSVKGMTISNRWVQYIYHRLAQHSHYHPEDELNEELYQKVEAKYGHLKERYIVATYLLTFEWLLKTRYFSMALYVFRLTPGKWKAYTLKRLLSAMKQGCLRQDRSWNLSEFYALYEK